MKFSRRGFLALPLAALAPKPVPKIGIAQYFDPEAKTWHTIAGVKDIYFSGLVESRCYSPREIAKLFAVPPHIVRQFTDRSV